MKLNKKAFTLTELLIALGVIGVLAAILMPVISNLLPDQNLVMAKRAYYATQNVVSDMINDADCYPDTSKTRYNERSKWFKRIGFDDGFKYPNCENWKADTSNSSTDYYKEGDDIPTGYKVGDPIEYKADAKFIEYFHNSVDLAQNSYKNPDTLLDVINMFATKDGMHWYIAVNYGGYNFTGNLTHACRDSSNPKITEQKCMPEAFISIFVDVNGEAGPNKMQPREHDGELGYQGSVNIKGTVGQTNNIAKKREKNSTYDTFEMRVYADGRIEIMDNWAKEAVNANRDLMHSSDIYNTDYEGS